MGVLNNLRKAWNAFQQSDNVTTQREFGTFGTVVSSGSSPQRVRPMFASERTIISSIYTRIGIDVSGVPIRHVQMDEQGLYIEDKDSALNQCFTYEPNMDQSPRAFRQDIATTLFDKGVAVVVPVITDKPPQTNPSFDVYSMRVAEVVHWYPKHVKVLVYNETTGKREELTLEKRFVAIIENPLYGVMNEPNSTLQRLVRKLSLLDTVDEASSSGKLDLIIQLPYVIKTEAKKEQAEQRRKDIEFQLRSSTYGIAYTDGTEKITQLNRPTENNLLKQVEYLTDMLYSQLGITAEVMNGTADEKAMLNYYNRTIEPIVDAIIESLQRAFLGVAGTDNHERIKYFRDPFKLVPLQQIAEIADKFTRNEILTSNEIRGFLGIQPSKDPKADKLVNSNMPQPEPVTPPASAEPPIKQQVN